MTVAEKMKSNREEMELLIKLQKKELLKVKKKFDDHCIKLEELVTNAIDSLTEDGEGIKVYGGCGCEMVDLSDLTFCFPGMEDEESE